MFEGCHGISAFLGRSLSLSVEKEEGRKERKASDSAQHIHGHEHSTPYGALSRRGKVSSTTAATTSTEWVDGGRRGGGYCGGS